MHGAPPASPCGGGGGDRKRAHLATGLALGPGLPHGGYGYYGSAHPAGYGYWGLRRLRIIAVQHAQSNPTPRAQWPWWRLQPLLLTKVSHNQATPRERGRTAPAAVVSPNLWTKAGLSRIHNWRSGTRGMRLL
jgi:hypothetical protein